MPVDGRESYRDSWADYQDCPADDVFWVEPMTAVQPGTTDGNVGSRTHDISTFASQGPIDIPNGGGRTFHNQFDELQASPNLNDFDPWLDEIELPLRIEDALLSEPTPDGLSVLEPQHAKDGPNSWMSQTAWMSGQNTVPTFSYIEASFSNRVLETESKKRKRTNFDEQQNQTLQTWLDLHRDNPYPTEEEFLSLCASTRLELRQVRNWFARTRQRKLVRHDAPTYQAPWANYGHGERPQHVRVRPRSSTSNEDSSPSSTIASLSLNARAGSSVQTDYDSDDGLCGTDLKPDASSIINTSRAKLQLHDSKLEWWLESVRDETPSQLIRPDQGINFPFEDVFDIEDAQSTSVPFVLEDSEHVSTFFENYIDAEPTVPDANYQEDTHAQQKFRTHVGFLLRRGKDTVMLDTPGSSNSSLRSLLRQMRNSRHVALSPSPSMADLSDNGRSLFSQRSCESRVSIRSAATSFSFGSRKGRRPQYWSPSIDLDEKTAHNPIPTPMITTTGTKENRCRFCNKTFSRPSSAVRHEKAIHAPDHWWICGAADEVDETHSCPVCASTHFLPAHDCHHEMEKCNFKPMKDRVFLRRDNFQDHLRRVHNLTRLECSRLDLSRWKHDTGDITAILDAQKKSRDFQDGLASLENIPATPRDWGVTLKDASDEESGGAEDVPMELDTQWLPRISPAQSTRRFQYRNVQRNGYGYESSFS